MRLVGNSGKAPIRRRLAALLATSLLLACGLLRPPAIPTPTQPGPATAITPAPLERPSATPSPLPTLDPTPATDLLGLAMQQQSLRPDFQADVDLVENPTRYVIQAEVIIGPEAQSARIAGTARILFANPLDRPVDSFALRLWPNNAQYRSEMTVGPALVDGEIHLGELGEGNTSWLLRLPEPLPAGADLDLSMPFTVEATGPILTDAPQRFGLTQGVLIAPTFYPIVPRLVDGEWELNPAPPGGDTTNSEMALYQVSLTVPADLDLIASGVEVEREARDDDRVTVRYVSGPMRDFAFALGPFEHDQREVGGVSVHVWVLSEHRASLRQVLDASSSQLELLSELVGPYPYTELDVVDAPGAFGGIEYPGLVYIGTVGTSWMTEPIVHEVAHQWFYGLIGDDQIEQPWLDEAAATYATALYYEFTQNPGRGTGYLTAFRDVLRDHPYASMPIGLGVGEYPSEYDYAVLVYWKGALFFDALRQEMGEDAFFAFLKDYYREYRYGFAQASDFHATAEAACACELDPLFDLWVYQGGELPVP